jgi:fermentation-respiration switch protein FrsA (DUF1100 family)
VREDIEFAAEDGVTLRGWLTTPEGAGPHACVVMSHGFSAVKEQTLEDLAVVLESAGLASVTYDHRNLGASDGEPRQEIDPVAQVRDLRTAITFAQSRPEVDSDRIGIFGSSYSGAHVLAVAALDQRVRAVVSQVPAISGYRTIERLNTADGFAGLLDALDAERAVRFGGEQAALLPVCSADPAGVCVFPGNVTYDYFHHYVEKGRSPSWRNEVTLRSIDLALAYDVTPYLPRISPTPLLMIITDQDTTTPTDLALEAFQLAREPKELMILPGHHYRVYLEGFEQTSRRAADFLSAHLAAAP